MDKKLENLPMSELLFMFIKLLDDRDRLSAIERKDGEEE